MHLSTVVLIWIVIVLAIVLLILRTILKERKRTYPPSSGGTGYGGTDGNSPRSDNPR